MPIARVHDGGVFAGVVDGAPTDYRLEVTYGTQTFTVDDPYRWLPTLGDVDLHLIGEGRHENLWEVLGAHVRTYDTPGGPVTGTSFAVWAPSARGVRVDGRLRLLVGAAPTRCAALGSSGVWELFIPDVGDGVPLQVPDPRRRQRVARQGRPDGVRHRGAAGDGVGRVHARPTSGTTTTGSSTAPRPVAHRADVDLRGAPRLVAAGAVLPQLADELVEYVRATGFTHVEFLPVAEHPFGGSWGYQVSSYYAPTSRFGSPDEFRYLVDRLHQAGIGVIVDWVPGHFPKDEFALARFDGTALYEHADPRRGEQPDWGTYVFNFGRSEVRNFLVANALYWLEEFHIDGLRVDAVASMLYLDYSRADGRVAAQQVRRPREPRGRRVPAGGERHRLQARPRRRDDRRGIDAWPGVTGPTHLGGLGFGFKWNMGWMHDTLSYIAHEPIHRQYHHNEMTFSMMYAYTENFVLPISHDEVVHGKGSLLGKMPGDHWQKMATLRALFAFMWAHPGKQLLFMGQEFAQGARVDRGRGPGLVAARRRPGTAACSGSSATSTGSTATTPALWSQDIDPAGFSWIDANDASGNVYSFLRFGERRFGAGVCRELLARPARGYRLGLPLAGRWDEVLNTDAEVYGGSGVGNFGGVDALDEGWHGQPSSVVAAGAAPRRDLAALNDTSGRIGSNWTELPDKRIRQDQD